MAEREPVFGDDVTWHLSCEYYDTTTVCWLYTLRIFHDEIWQRLSGAMIRVGYLGKDERAKFGLRNRLGLGWDPRLFWVEPYAWCLLTFVTRKHDKMMRRFGGDDCC